MSGFVEAILLYNSANDLNALSLPLSLSLSLSLSLCKQFCILRLLSSSFLHISKLPAKEPRVLCGQLKYIFLSQFLTYSIRLVLFYSQMADS